MDNREVDDFDSDMDSHFSNIADRYKTLRHTDIDPILFIKSFIPISEKTKIIDIGSGTGRYDELILAEFGPQVYLTCVDKSAEMIDELTTNLSAKYYSQFDTIISEVEKLSVDENSYDLAVSFNAFHHFNLFQALKSMATLTKIDGDIFIYTRTPTQNANSLWGQYFPKFMDTENRLYAVSDIELACSRIKEISLTSIIYFSYKRESSLENLLERVNSKHYSTFSLYDSDELIDCSKRFKANVRDDYPWPNLIRWTDGNVLYIIKKI